MSSTEILKLFMVVAFCMLVITDLSAVADSDVNSRASKNQHCQDEAQAKLDPTKLTNNESEKTEIAAFKQLDFNQDGKLSLKEAIKNKALIDKFDSADNNSDGMISADEYFAFSHG